jgi:hypothetical protein
MALVRAATTFKIGKVWRSRPNIPHRRVNSGET